MEIVLKNANAGRVSREVDAETTPLRNPGFYRFEFDIAEVTEVWRRSVIGSWLLDLTAAALRKNPELTSFEAHVSDSGEGRWTLQAAIDEGVPVPVISAALFGRFESRELAEYTDKLLWAMRYEFGGHIEKPATLEAMRACAVNRSQDGESPAIVARVLGLDRPTGYGGLARYRGDGWNGLKAKTLFGRPPKLSGGC